MYQKKLFESEEAITLQSPPESPGIQETCTTRLEQAIWARGYKSLAGVDEVGRGAWAGPVITAAVILDPEQIPAGLNDSKKLSAAQRLNLAELVKESARGLAFGTQSAAEIDTYNILEATRRAMMLAIEELIPGPDFLLIDAVHLPKVKIPARSIIRGDAQSVSIAAASIVAKVYRDQLMTAYDTEFPGYGFARHKGYGTAEHQVALDKLGPSLIHRLSFRGVVKKEANFGLLSPVSPSF
ncbi:MAG: ribonuclease HII [Acidobacteria bacterium]|nr:ribonuclease HII [Acidobacteriota bacterium]